MLIENNCLATQRTFRTLLQAMSRPGMVYNIGDSISDSPVHPFTHSSLMLVLRTLLNHEVTFSIIGQNENELDAIIRSTTGSCSTDLEKADFVVVPSGDSRAAILRAKRGSLEYPDTGATLIYNAEFPIDGNPGKTGIVLKGPGIEDEVSLPVNRHVAGELKYLKEINSEFPLGVDSIFVDRPGRVMCIPRSTKIEVK